MLDTEPAYTGCAAEGHAQPKDSKPVVEARVRPCVMEALGYENLGREVSKADHGTAAEHPRVVMNRPAGPADLRSHSEAATGAVHTGPSSSTGAGPTPRFGGRRGSSTPRTHVSPLRGRVADARVESSSG